MVSVGALWFVAVAHQLWVLLVCSLVRLVLPLSVLAFLEHVRHMASFAWISWRAKSQGSSPADACPRKELDLAGDSKSVPMVGVQLPIFNERAVCQTLIDYACNLDWPSNRLVIQVLDDSTDAKTRQLVDDKVAEWQEKGVVVKAVRRTNRAGYKAGALKQGLDALADCAYVAVFDADFKPEPHFLTATIPYLEGDARVAYVQARWTFSNAGESWLTQAQEVSLNHHFKCEQFVHFSEGSFFNFNGTAGVWRAAAIHDVGGWSSRTTVEDMDLSLRTYLAGWRAVFLNDVTAVSELPSSLFAFRKQQHRWTTGPVQLMTKVLPVVWRSPLPRTRKLELLLSFFLMRKLLVHVLCLGFYCLLLPISVLTAQVTIPTWALLHVPLAITLSTCFFTKGGWRFSITYVLFQNAMGLVKAWACIAGLLGLRGANEWVVTTKLGRGKREDGGAAAVEIPGCRVYPAELAMGGFMLASALVGIANGAHFGVTAFLVMQGVTFAAFGCNMVSCTSGAGWNAEKPWQSLRHTLFGCLL